MRIGNAIDLLCSDLPFDDKVSTSFSDGRIDLVRCAVCFAAIAITFILVHTEILVRFGCHIVVKRDLLGHRSARFTILCTVRLVLAGGGGNVSGCGSYRCNECFPQTSTLTVAIAITTIIILVILTIAAIATAVITTHARITDVAVA